MFLQREQVSEALATGRAAESLLARVCVYNYGLTVRNKGICYVTFTAGGRLVADWHAGRAS